MRMQISLYAEDEPESKECYTVWLKIDEAELSFTPEQWWGRLLSPALACLLEMFSEPWPSDIKKFIAMAMRGRKIGREFFYRNKLAAES